MPALLITSGSLTAKNCLQRFQIAQQTMVWGLSWLLGPGAKDPDRQTQRGLPASWYRAPEMYELERRAIFSKQWLLVTHKNRIKQPGDYVRFTEAGFSFFLCRDRQGNLGGFHNICRHRGFPLLHDDAGNAKILACKYHGWSYGLNGSLAKAPHFESFADFDKSNNDLFPIHLHVDKLGFVWVNLEASTTPSTSWDDLFLGVDAQPRVAMFRFEDYNFDHVWGMEGNYNWKTLGDNYNECLHCKTAHPDTDGVVDITMYRVQGTQGHLKHYINNEGGQKKFPIASTYYYPNACMTVS